MLGCGSVASMRILCNHCGRKGCRFCYLYATDQRYRTLWGGDQLPADQGEPEQPPKPLPKLRPVAPRKPCGCKKGVDEAK